MGRDGHRSEGTGRENYLIRLQAAPCRGRAGLRPDGMRVRYLAAPLTGGRAPMGRRPCAGKGKLVDVE
jgi:hypothetical protein